ncbi:FAD-dependent monooxygenase [Planosporangium thailandense]|uniref:FAD-dependent monooxygenase n=2 Tax=Planosporangium thailandense TaxID=765197 RepID=A0ABX0Y7C2_9ACTN|nr:NAD(P)/FAD-dependent oxidoreductase [Planosporangium thailandense]NJC73194.1 FAD-dependent monooxygenase [Planosporangium thailandense]
MPSGVRHAEVAGGGLAGLTVATALAQRGWSVRVHERGRELREIGAGIFMWENALRALEQTGAYEEATHRAERINSWKLYDERQRLIQDDWMKSDDVRLYLVLRTDLHRALANAAQRAGVEIVTSSLVAGASPDGELYLESGESHKADLIIGADGVGSPVRNSLGLDRVVRDLEDGCSRHLIPRMPQDPVNNALEYWNGGRRVGICPVTPDMVYVYTCCPASDLAGREKPLNKESWSKSFPTLRHVFDRIPDVSRWASFSDVRTHSWVKGRVALVGDAASAMSPNLGQAACLAMTNGYALGMMLDGAVDVPTALRGWEARQRPVTDATQKYSRLYGRVGTRWPRPLTDVRSALIWAAGKSRPWQARVNVAAHEGAELIGKLAK